MTLIIGTAGWSISKRHAQAFPEEGSALQRYAARFRGFEINSSFYRPHRSSTWARWHDSVPQDFRFAVKMRKAVSHQCRSLDCREQTATFIENIDALGSKLDVLLLQLPPSLAFDETAVGNFFEMSSGLTDVRTACEPHMRAGSYRPPTDYLPIWESPGSRLILFLWPDQWSRAATAHLNIGACTDRPRLSLGLRRRKNGAFSARADERGWPGPRAVGASSTILPSLLRSVTLCYSRPD